MPSFTSLYRDDQITLDVDWEGDGEFDHARHDVSGLWGMIRFQQGTSRRSNPQRPTIAHGRGSIELIGDDFVPGRSALLDESQLRSRRLFRLNQGSVRIADGWIQDAQHQRYNRTRFGIEGVLERTGRESHMIAQGLAPATTTGDSALALLKDSYGLLDADFSHNIRTTPLALYSFNGPAAGYASRFGLVAGALPIARTRSRLALIDPTILPSPPPPIYSTSEYVILGATTEFDSEQLWNVLSTSYPSVIEGMDEASVLPQDSVSNNSEDLVLRTAESLPSTILSVSADQNQRIVSGRFRIRPYAWSNVSAGSLWLIDDIPPSVNVMTREQQELGLYDHYVQGDPQADGSLQATITSSFTTPFNSSDARIDAINVRGGRVLFQQNNWAVREDGAGAREITTAGVWHMVYEVSAEYQLEVPDSEPVLVGNQDSVDEWDPRTIIIPGWIQSSATTALQARIDAYAEPRDIHTVDFSLWQPDAARTRSVAGIQPGDFIGLDISDRPTDTEINTNVMVMNQELILRRNEIPVKRLTCIQSGTESATTANFLKLVSGDFFLLSDGASKLELVG